MFDFFRSHMKLLQLVLLPLVFIAFVLVGVEGYKSSQQGANETIAKVDGRAIKQGEFDFKQRETLDRMRRQMPNVDAKLFDTPQMKQQIVDDLVRERVLEVAAHKGNLTTTNDRLLHLYLTDPQFAQIRKPDGSIDAQALETALSAQGMTVAQFESGLRREMDMRQVMFGIGATVAAPATATAQALDAMFQQREVQLQQFDAKEFQARVNPSAAEIEAYYKANPSRFQSPENAAIEYVVLDLDTLKKSVTIPEEDLRKYYTENAARYATPEERRASHILIKADKSMTAEQRAAAKAKAESLLAELKKRPAAFAELARKNSDDPGSAVQGGDLDFFGRGAMVKPFEDTVFSLKPGQISELVETDFGYHIIQLTQVRGGDKRSFESVRAEIEDEVKKAEAQRRFSEASLDFTNTVYEQADSLKPVVDKLKLELKSADNVQRTPAAGATGALASPKFLEALFSSDALRNKRNIEAVEIGPNQLASARVLRYTPSATLSLADVTPRIRETLVAEQATALARKEGEARLEALRKAPDTALQAPTQLVSRAQSRQLPRELVAGILKAPADKLPAYVGIDLGAQGYVVAKITKVAGRDPVVADAQQASTQYAQAWAQAESLAYYESLKKRFKAEVVKPMASASAPS
jgi:peptidyl-prolyl cis-trans isomerase D